MEKELDWTELTQKEIDDLLREAGADFKERQEKTTPEFQCRTDTRCAVIL